MVLKAFYRIPSFNQLQIAVVQVCFVVAILAADYQRRSHDGWNWFQLNIPKHSFYKRKRSGPFDPIQLGVLQLTPLSHGKFDIRDGAEDRSLI